MPPMEIQGTPGFGTAQKKKLAEVLAEIKGFHPSVSIDDGDDQYVFALTVSNLVVRLQNLAVPILPVDTASRLNAINVEDHDLFSASKAKEELDVIVTVIEDVLSNRPDTLLPGALEQLLKSRELDTVSKEIERALRTTENDPPVSITAARAALESLLKVYREDKGLTMPGRPTTGKLLKAVMADLGLDPAEKADKAVQSVLQSLWSVVYGIADLRTHAGSAHGHGKHPYQLHARHARLAVQASQAFIEFFVETWNYRERRSLSD